MPDKKFGNAVMAPMAGVTGYPFRKIALKWGADFCFTEMISATGFLRNDKATMELAFAGNLADRTGIQLFGSNPEELASAAQKAALLGFSAVDINMGCPVKKVVKSGAGSSILKDLGIFSAIVASVRRAIPEILFTIKIRSGFDGDSVNFLDTGKIAESSGVDAIFFHPRTRASMFSGTADHSLTKKLKEAVSIPVYASGDIFTVDDAVRIKHFANPDGIMFARGAIGKPWIFNEYAMVSDLSGTVKPPENASIIPSNIDVRLKTAAMLELMEEMNIFYGIGRGYNLVKPHLYSFIKGFRGSKKLRGMLNGASSEKDIANILKITENEAQAS